MTNDVYDVLIVGGSYAGMQAALTLARSLRKVLVVDAGKPCNRYVQNAHNLLMHDGDKPDDIAAASKEQVLTYPGVAYKEATIEHIERSGTKFIARDQQGEMYTARKIVLATGVKDVLPELPGFRECWGKSIVHCPYCHGYEVKGRKIGLLVPHTIAREFLSLLYNWSADLILFTNGTDFTDRASQKFVVANSIRTIPNRVTKVEHKDGNLCAVHTNDGGEYEVDALFTSVPFEQQAIVSALGCALDEKGLVETNVVGATSIEGVYAAGDCLTSMRAISVAIASGYRAGIGINNELINEEWEDL
ncbi:MAG: NAD(P)/FAD-dependent oxidoreductase [Flavipsychrobacter sp.]|nr:NAD(P)/FAD-dependent oxidoreductase [Flavipsychrobacter sp.]